MSEIFRELDYVYIIDSVPGLLTKDFTKFIVPSGTEGTIVLVYGKEENPEAYEIEFFIEEHNCTALATVPAALVMLKRKFV